MFRALENFAAIGALPLEHGAGVMQTMGQHMQRGLAPRHELAVIPDHPLKAVIRFLCHVISSLYFCVAGRHPVCFAPTMRARAGRGCNRFGAAPRVRSFRSSRLLDNNLPKYVNMADLTVPV